MEYTLVVAKAFGMYLIVSGLFLIVRGKTLPVILKDFFEHPAIIFLTGTILMFFGAVLLLRNSSVTGASGAWVKILGWFALLKGVAYLFIPETFAKANTKTLRPWLGLFGVVMIILGVYLARLG